MSVETKVKYTGKIKAGKVSKDKNRIPVNILEVFGTRSRIISKLEYVDCTDPSPKMKKYMYMVSSVRG